MSRKSLSLLLSLILLFSSFSSMGRVSAAGVDLLTFCGEAMAEMDQNYSADPAVRLTYRDGEEPEVEFTDSAIIQAIWNTMRGVMIGEKSDLSVTDLDQIFVFTTQSGKEMSVIFNSPELLSFEGSNYEVENDNGLFNIVKTMSAFASPVGEKPEDTPKPETTGNEEVKQINEDDIDAMNDGRALFAYSDEGYVTSIVGRWTDMKINDQEDCIESLRPIQAILGLGKGSEFFAVYGAKDAKGYTYYTFQQRYGTLTLENATLRVIVDPEGYTAGLSCSFTPNVGIAEPFESISAEAAEEVVRSQYPYQDLKIYSEYTKQIAIQYDKQTVNVWAVFTNNPEENDAFNLPYEEHYVRVNGSYLTMMMTNTLQTSASENYNVDSYFEPMVPQDYSRTILLGDGTTRDVTVKVCQNNNDGKYYLCDPERKIMVADYYSFVFDDTVAPITSTNGTDWSDNHLMAYYNYKQAYDYYDSFGIQSVDGFGIPMLITVNYVDENHNPVNNACYYGNHLGWACFAVSDGNNYSMAQDVVGHEFTHGVTSSSMMGCAYYNESGAINEAYSDIFGNLIEMATGATSDRDWLINETTGRAMRSMSDPNRYQQPAFVGDTYYQGPVVYRNNLTNDLGGVHINNTLLSSLAYSLDQEGMTYEQQTRMWLTTIQFITPHSDYDDVHCAILFSLVTNGLEEYASVVNQYFQRAGLNAIRNQSYLESTKEDCGRLYLEADEKLTHSPIAVVLFDVSGQVFAQLCPDENGIITMLLPIGYYSAKLFVIQPNGQRVIYNYTDGGWKINGDPTLFEIQEGKKTALHNLSSGSSDSGKTEGGKDDNSREESTEESGLKLVQYDGGDFTCLAPSGWSIIRSGAGEYTWFFIYDPQDPSTFFAYYKHMEPFLKSYDARITYQNAGYPPMLSRAVVLLDLTAGGLLNLWDELVDYNIMMAGRQELPSIKDIEIFSNEIFEGPYYPYGGQDSIASCYAEVEGVEDCILTIRTSVISEGYVPLGGVDMGYYSLRDTLLMSSTQAKADEITPVLVQCLNSIQLKSNKNGIDGETEITSIEGIRVPES